MKINFLKLNYNKKIFLFKRAGRIVRLVRLIRIVKLYKAASEEKKDDDDVDTALKKYLE